MHNLNASLRFAIQDGPVDRGRATIFGQQRRVDVDTAVLRICQNIIRQNTPIGRHHDQLRVHCAQIPQCLPIPHFAWLKHWNIMRQGTFLYRAYLDLHPSVFWLIRLRKHPADLMAGDEQSLQRGDGKFRRAHKENPQRFFPSSASIISSSSFWV